MTYAKGTKVPVARSKTEIDKVLRKHGATAIMMGEQFDTGALVAFQLAARNVRIDVPLPQVDEFRRGPWGDGTRRYTEAQANRRCEQATRERWRAVVLLLKAKLEAISLGHTTVEREFLYGMMLPDGQTFGGALESGSLDRVLGPSGVPLLPGSAR